MCPVPYLFFSSSILCTSFSFYVILVELPFYLDTICFLFLSSIALKRFCPAQPKKPKLVPLKALFHLSQTKPMFSLFYKFLSITILKTISCCKLLVSVEFYALFLLYIFPPFSSLNLVWH